MFDITDSLRNQKHILTTTDVRDIDGTFVVKLRGLKIENHHFNTKLPLNEVDKIFEEKLNDINYKKTIRKINDVGWENSYFTSADVFMLGYACGVSQYPQFYDKHLFMYQVLPRPNIGYFDGFTVDRFIKKWAFRLGRYS